jgi:ubiquinone/menaquinone biosynthesis C-methylase UbiE
VARVLDIGSGPGRDGILLQEAGADVVCLDASESMIELTRQKGLFSVCADFNTIPFPDNSFDGVWAYTSLLHVPKKDIEVPLREIKRVLKPRGIFGLGLIEGVEEGYRKSAGVSLPRYFAYYGREEVQNLLGNNGFEIVHLDTFRVKSKNYLHFLAKLAIK